MTVYERTTLAERDPRTDRADAARAVDLVLRHARGGSRYEPKESSGIAHFAEHMFFKGTENRPTSARHHERDRLDRRRVQRVHGQGVHRLLRQVRGRVHATWRSTSSSTCSATRSSTPEEIEREKGVIIEEMNMYFDTPRDFIGGSTTSSSTATSRSAGTSSAPRRPCAPRRARRSSTTSGSWYRPERIVVGVGGKIEGDLIAELEELLGDIEPASTGTAAPASRSRATARAAQVKVHTKQSDQAHLVLGVRSYPLQHPDRYALQLLTTVLGGGMSSRLFTEVRERRGLAYYVFGHNNSYTDAGSLYAQAGVDINRIDEAVTTIVAELRRITEEPVPSAELEKARNSAKGRFVLQLESPHGTIMFGLRREVLEGKASSRRTCSTASTPSRAEDIQRIAQDVIAGDGLNLALIGPFDDAEHFQGLRRSRRAETARSRRASWHLPGSARQSAFNCADLGACPSRTNQAPETRPRTRPLRVAEARRSNSASASSRPASGRWASQHLPGATRQSAFDLDACSSWAAPVYHADRSSQTCGEPDDLRAEGVGGGRVDLRAVREDDDDPRPGSPVDDRRGVADGRRPAVLLRHRHLRSHRPPEADVLARRIGREEQPQRDARLVARQARAARARGRPTAAAWRLHEAAGILRGRPPVGQDRQRPRRVARGRCAGAEPVEARERARGGAEAPERPGGRGRRRRAREPPRRTISRFEARLDDQIARSRISWRSSGRPAGRPSGRARRRGRRA